MSQCCSNIWEEIVLEDSNLYMKLLATVVSCLASFAPCLHWQRAAE